MTSEFRFAYLSELNKPLVIEGGRIADLKQGQLLVKIEGFGICGSQISEIQGRKGNAGYLPHLLGHEGVGRVVNVHPSVNKVKAGDRVVVHWRKGSGLEGGISEITKSDGLVVSGGPATVYGEFSVVGENRVTVIDDGTDFAAGVMLGCGLSTGFGAVDREGSLKTESRVLILGMGGVGLSVLFAVSLKGAETVTAFDRFESKRELATNLGATEFSSNFSDLGKTGKFDLVFECTGDPQVRSQIGGLLAPAATVVLLGQHSPETKVGLGSERDLFGSEGTTWKFSQGGGFRPDIDIPNWAKSIEAKHREIGLLSQVFDVQLDDINDIIRDMSQGKIQGRPIVRLIQA